MPPHSTVQLRVSELMKIARAHVAFFFCFLKMKKYDLNAQLMKIVARV